MSSVSKQKPTDSSAGTKVVFVRKYPLPVPGNVWHTAIIIEDEEFHFGGDGIKTSAPGESGFGKKYNTVEHGITTKSNLEICEFLQKCREGPFAIGKYEKFEWNCNNFTDKFGIFLVGKGLEKELLEGPKKALQTAKIAGVVSIGLAALGVLGSILLKSVKLLIIVIVSIITLIVTVLMTYLYYDFKYKNFPMKKINKLCEGFCSQTNKFVSKSFLI